MSAIKRDFEEHFSEFTDRDLLEMGLTLDDIKFLDDCLGGRGKGGKKNGSN